MAENVQITPGSGVTIGADSVADGVLGSAQIQYIKIMDGTIGGTNKAAVTANGLAVDGSGATQPISALTLPLPTGAATELTLGDIKSDLDQFTFVASKLLIDGSTVTQPISAVALPLPAGAATESTLSAVKDDVDNLDVALSTRATEATLANVKSDLDQFTFVASALLVDGSGAIQPVSGTVTANAGTGNFTVVQSVGANLHTEIDNFPSSQTVNGTVAATQSGTWTVALSSGSIEIGTVDQGSPNTLANAWPFEITDGTNLLGVSAHPVRIDPTGTTTQPISGTVTANQGTSPWVVSLASTTITGTVAVTQSTSPWVVSGTVTANAGTGTFAVSAASLPLPTGASTSAKQPALGTAGTASSDVITVQGIASMTALKVDGSAVTQPISGSVSISNFPATQPVSGTITANQGTSPWVVSVASTTITGTVAVTQSTSPWVVSGTVTSNIGTTNGLALDATIAALEVGQASTTSGQKGILQLGAVTTGSPTYTTAQTSALSLTTAGALRVDASATTQPISGSVTVANATIAVTQSGTWNLNNISGTISLPTGASTEATLSSLNGKVTAVNTGAVTISTALPAGTNVIGHVIADSGSTTAVTGNVSVVQSTAANLNATVSQGTAASATNKWPVCITDSGGVNQATVNGSGQLEVVAPAITKGTQGATGFTTQDLKDAGRTFITFTADAIAGVTTEALVSFTLNKAGTTTAAQTNYTITNGKTLRIQTLSASVQAGAAAGEWLRAKLRINTAGATTATSPLIVTVEAGNIAATTATAGTAVVAIPDGLEITGNGTITIGLSHLSSATTNTESISLVAYEY